MTAIHDNAVFLASAAPEQIIEFVKAHGQPEFRARQIIDWVYRKYVLQPDAMKNLPLELREALKAEFKCATSEIEAKQQAGDGTCKLLIRLEDGESIEMVIIPAPDRITFCLSTQVGCPVQCRFCASGADGLIRNLKAGEIIEQLYHGCGIIGRLPDNIVFMGVGEGLLNFDNLGRSLEIICDSQYIDMASRRITVSTSGYVPGIYKLAELGRPVNLAVSLHAPNDEIRAKLIPDKLRFPVSEILEACELYREKIGRMVTFEYTLVAGINDSRDAAKKLAEIAFRTRTKVNLIPYNEVETSDCKRPDDRTLKTFESILLKRGVQVTMRQEKGSKVSAACGQLRATAKNKTRS